MGDSARFCSTCGAGAGPQPQEDNLAAGTPLHEGKFVVERVLGEGGFGITYKGLHQDLQRAVAIKEIFPQSLGVVRRGTRVTASAAQHAAFLQGIEDAMQEARIIAQLQSKSIVDIYDVFRENGTAYIVMEFLEGPTLDQRIKDGGPLPLDDAQRIALDLCGALEEVHGRNLLHRDIKPANVILRADGLAVLIDFGSVRAFQIQQTVRHTRILTEEYAAPELYSQAARFGPYTDLFCLGATLYHALTGAPPPRALERLQAPQRDLALPAGLQGELGQAVQRALALRVEDRPQTATEFRQALQTRLPHPPPAVPAAVTPAVPSAAPTQPGAQPQVPPALGQISVQPSPASGSDPPSRTLWANSRLQPVSTAGAAPYAAFWKRAVAFCIDHLLVIIVGTLLSAMIGLETEIVIQLIILIIGWLYFAVMESSHRQGTVGKMALGIKVTDMDGNRIRFSKATGRYFGKQLSFLILGIGFLMAAFSEKKQSLHDRLAECLVVNK